MIILIIKSTSKEACINNIFDNRVFTLINIETIKSAPKEFYNIYQDISTNIVGVITVLKITTYGLRYLKLSRELPYKAREQLYKGLRSVLVWSMWYASFSKNELNIHSMFIVAIIFLAYDYFLLPDCEKIFLYNLGLKQFMSEAELDELQETIKNVSLPNPEAKIELGKKYLDRELIEISMAFKIQHVHVPEIHVTYRGNWTISTEYEEIHNRLLLSNRVVNLKIKSKMLLQNVGEFIKRRY